MTTPIPELTDRMRQIFGLVVEAYIDRGAPVGSKMLTGSVSLSPASIRGVMQELEELGLLTHPHTSAGRLPTETGLRLFVDGIMGEFVDEQSLLAQRRLGKIVGPIGVARVEMNIAGGGHDDAARLERPPLSADQPHTVIIDGVPEHRAG